MSIVASTIEGQIVIPAEIRKKFKIVKGTRVNVYEDDNKIIYRKVLAIAKNTFAGNFSLVKIH